VAAVGASSDASTYSVCATTGLASAEDFGKCDEALKALSTSEVNYLIGQAKKWDERHERGEVSGTRAEFLDDAVVVPLWEGSQLSTDDHIAWGGRREFGILTLAPTVFSFRAQLALGASAFMLLTVFALILTVRRRRARQQEFLIGRTFQVGLLQLDTHDTIIASNDRGEELLGVRLKRFGTTGDTQATASFHDP
ncbi:MAG TPA: hypothetical protein VGC79_03760, partial [Polyangiaceae bacterium]